MKRISLKKQDLEEIANENFDVFSRKAMTKIYSYEIGMMRAKLMWNMRKLIFIYSETII